MSVNYDYVCLFLHGAGYLIVNNYSTDLFKSNELNIVSPTQFIRSAQSDPLYLGEGAFPDTCLWSLNYSSNIL